MMDDGIYDGVDPLFAPDIAEGCGQLDEYPPSPVDL